MNREELIEKINTVLADEFEANVEDITANAPLMDTLDMDRDRKSTRLNSSHIT